MSQAVFLTQFYVVQCYPYQLLFTFGQNFIEEKKLETQLDTATQICEDLKNISGADLGKLMHINWYEELYFELMCCHQF